jgi:hypothetical protein
MGAAVRVMVQKGRVELRRGEGPMLDLRANMLAQVDDDQAVPLRVEDRPCRCRQRPVMAGRKSDLSGGAAGRCGG